LKNNDYKAMDKFKSNKLGKILYKILK